MANPPRNGLTPAEKDELRDALARGSREPFRDVLTEALGCAPSPEAWQSFADKSPDRWAQAVAILSRGAGYSEKVEIEHTGLIGLAAKIGKMSDAELEVEYRRLNERPRASNVVAISGVARSLATSTPKDAASGGLSTNQGHQ